MGRCNVLREIRWEFSEQIREGLLALRSIITKNKTNTIAPSHLRLKLKSQGQKENPPKSLKEKIAPAKEQ